MTTSTSNLRILQVHNSHAPGWGGEETVVELEYQLLRRRGHAVQQFQISNAPLKNASVLQQLLVAPGMLWSRKTYKKLQQVIEQFHPHVVHVHNTFPRFSPSVFWAANKAEVPIVQTLHNFRNTCANAVLFRDDKPCEDCVGGRGWTALRHKCYSGSFVRTGGVLAMNALHRSIGTFTNKVDAYIALNHFSKSVFLRSGLPPEKVVVKSNFVPESSLRQEGRSLQIVFVGSMMRHKGVHLLLDAWQNNSFRDAKLLLIGDGPEWCDWQEKFKNAPQVTWAGSLPHDQVLQRIRESRALILPTLVYENCPMVLLEAFAEGTPVIVPDLPSMATFVGDEREGLLYRAGDAAALAAALRKIVTAPEDVWSEWSKNCRDAHSKHYTESVNYHQLISIYQSVIGARGRVLNAEKILNTAGKDAVPVEVTQP